jgi:hypothetical protein
VEQDYLEKEIANQIKLGRAAHGSHNKPEALKQLEEITHRVSDFSLDTSSPYLTDAQYLAFLANTQVASIKKLEAKIDDLIAEIMKAAMGIKPVNFRVPFAPLETVKNQPLVKTYDVSKILDEIRLINNNHKPLEVIA